MGTWQTLNADSGTALALLLAPDGACSAYSCATYQSSWVCYPWL